MTATVDLVSIKLTILECATPSSYYCLICGISMHADLCG